MSQYIFILFEYILTYDTLGIKYINICSQALKYHRRSAVLETGVSLLYGGLIEGSSEAPRISRQYGIAGYKGGPQLGLCYAENCKFLGQATNKKK